MRSVILTFLLLSLLVPRVVVGKATQPQKSPRIEKTINSYWTFNYFPGDRRGVNYEVPGFDDSKWPLISIPHTWSTYETTGELHPFIKNTDENENPYWWTGWGWYRKNFRITTDFTDKKVFLEFEGVQKYCMVWINGKYLGDHKGGYGSFDFDITEHLIRGKDNLIAVAVSNRQRDEFNIPPMAAEKFNVYGGILCDVRVVIKDRLHIPMQGSASHEGGTFITTPVVSAKAAVARVQTWVRNEYSDVKSCVLKTYLLDASGRVIQVVKTKASINPGQIYRFDQTLKPVKNPNLWSPGSPYLYTIWSELSDGIKATDSYTSPFGFRWFRWDYSDNSLYVNGKKININGVRRVSEYPWMGGALPQWLINEELEEIKKEPGLNFLSTAFFPDKREVYDFTDRSGIIVSEELPNVRNQAFASEVQQQMLLEMVRRDRNHPSVMFWGIGNETSRPAEPSWVLAADTTRIITGSGVVTAPGVRIHSFGKTAGGNRITDYVRKTGRGNYPSRGTAVPAKIVLSASSQKVTADPATVIVVTADITDQEGRYASGYPNNLRWSVSGPGIIAGPAAFDISSSGDKRMEGVWASGLPCFNVIRSTGKAGKIRVIVSSSGLASGVIEIEADAAKIDDSIITWTIPDDRGRLPVARQFFPVARLDDIPGEIRRTSEDLIFRSAGRTGYASAVKEHILRNNQVPDTATVEFRSLISILASHLTSNGGSLIADDYNYNIDHYNNCRLIAGYINATKLPPLFKETLREYYAEEIIAKGNEKNPGDEMNWLNWIPSGGTVIVSQDENSKTWPKGTFVTSKTNLYDLIITVYPVFGKYSDDARKRALIFISKANPYITVKEDAAGTGQTTYTAQKGKPVLIPLLKFISE
jgi:hypothetical protein